MAESVSVKIIARIHTDFPTKFGIPRQSGLVEELRGRVVFEPEYQNPDALRGLEGFSHIWLLWQFSQAVREDWSPTVRPPRLGGNERMGVFATRSPFRPNAMGLSCVKLEGVNLHTPDGPTIVVSGADLMDGTPIFDIKPYVPYVDAHPDARGGFAAERPDRLLEVDIPPALLAQIPECRRAALRGVLACDPRPSYQKDPQRVYGLDFGGENIKFTVDGETLTVREIKPLDMRDRIQTLFENYVTEHRFSGVALIKQKDNIIFEFATGFAHKGYQIHNSMETKFDTASITKLFTAAGIVLLESKGKLHFTDKIHDIIDLSSTEIPADVEIRHLLTHTSGIADDADEENGEDYSALFVDSPNYAVRENKDFLKNFAHKKPNFKVGTAVRYNNCAFVLLGLVIEQITGISYREFIEENIFKFFGMQNTMFHAMDDVGGNIAEGYYFSEKEQKHKKNIYSYPPIGTGDSGAYTTAYDLDKFFRAVKSSTIFSKMLQPQTELTRSNEAGVLRYGYGFEFIEQNGVITSIYKDGCNAGVCNITAYYPSLDTTFTILGNQDCNVWRLHDLVQKLLLEEGLEWTITK